MSEKSNIEWCDSTVNFWSGCTKVSPGCANCYAEARDKRHMIEKVDHWGKGAPRLKHITAVTSAIAMNNYPWVCGCTGAQLLEPAASHCSVCGVEFHRRRIFTNSLSDWLDAEVPIERLAEMLDTIRQCDEVIWILCTKRPQNFFQRFQQVRSRKSSCHPGDEPFLCWMDAWLNGQPPKNIILLTSVENQAMADKRIAELLKLPAVCRGLSLEPLLEEVDLTKWLDDCNGVPRDMPFNWLIIGGESGPNARPCDMLWIHSLVAQGKAAAVPTFVKQLGKLAVCGNVNCFDWPDEEMLNGHGEGFASMRLMTLDPKGGDMAEWPEELKVRNFPTLDL